MEQRRRKKMKKSTIIKIVAGIVIASGILTRVVTLIRAEIPIPAGIPIPAETITRVISRIRDRTRTVTLPATGET